MGDLLIWAPYNIVRLVPRISISFPQSKLEKTPLWPLAVGTGMKQFLNKAEHSVLNKVCPQEKLVNQSLVDLVKGDEPTPAHSNHPVLLKGRENN